jgi:hypothetical protein
MGLRSDNFADPHDNEGAVRLQYSPAMAAQLARRDATSCPMALRPLHHRGDRNVEPIRHQPDNICGLSCALRLGVGNRP